MVPHTKQRLKLYGNDYNFITFCKRIFKPLVNMKKVLGVYNLALRPLIFTWIQNGNGIEAATQRCSVKKVFLQISQNLQENACATVPLVNNQVCVFE